MQTSNETAISTIHRLDDKGRCCGRKPIVYKRPPSLFCHRCDRSFDPATGTQKENWAFRWTDAGFVSTKVNR